MSAVQDKGRTVGRHSNPESKLHLWCWFKDIPQRRREGFIGVSMLEKENVVDYREGIQRIGTGRRVRRHGYYDEK